MKKFLIYFVVIFVMVFGFLNSRFVSAQIKYWFGQGATEKIVQLVSPSVNPTKSVTPTPSATPLVRRILPVVQSKDYVLVIPALGVKAPIVLEKSTDPDQIFNRLEEGVVHYNDSPLPGEPGVSLILGHSSAYPWYKGQYGSVFALLNKLQPGETFTVQNGSRTLTYKVTGSLVFHPFSKDKSIQQFEQASGSNIILVSCWPVGTNFKRIAVKAQLI